MKPEKPPKADAEGLDAQPSEDGVEQPKKESTTDESETDESETEDKEEGDDDRLVEFIAEILDDHEELYAQLEDIKQRLPGHGSSRPAGLELEPRVLVDRPVEPARPPAERHIYFRPFKRP